MTESSAIPLQLTELFFPLISLGTLMVAFVSSALVSRRYRSPRFRVVLMLLVGACIYILADLTALVETGIHGRVRNALLATRFMELSATWFVFLVPRFVRSIVTTHLRRDRILAAMEVAGMAIAASITVVAFAAPDLFMSITTPAANRAAYAGLVAGGVDGPLMRVRDAALGVQVIGSTAILVASLRGRRLDAPTAILLVGFLGGLAFGMSALGASILGEHLGPLRAIRFSRLGAGFTLFGLAATASYIAMFVDQAGQLDDTNRELAHRRDRLSFLAFHDALTQMRNRSAFIRDLEARLNGEPGTIVLAYLLDVDDFGAVIESFGFAVADHLLVAIGKRLDHLAATNAPDGCAYRTGSDQFALLIPAASDGISPANQAQQMGSQVVARLSEPFGVDGREILTTASVGFFEATAGTDTGDGVTQRLIRALVEAKREHNAARRYSTELHRSVENRVQLVNRLRQAVRAGSFALVYQPIVDDQRRMVGAEALIRWKATESEPAPPGPDQFIPVAEQSGLIGPITDFVVAEACGALPALVEMNAAFVLHINVSARHMRVRTLAPRIAAHLAQAGVAPSNLGIEITETSFVSRTELVMSTLRELDELGVRLGIDDFGVGFSSLSYLASLPTREIKVDRSFVRGIPDNPEQVAIVESVVGLAQRLGKTVIAEGVETDEQFEVLQAMGITRFQGYLFSRPIPLGACLAMGVSRSGASRST